MGHGPMGFPDQPLGLGPADASVGDGHAALQVFLVCGEGLAPGLEIAFDHCADNGSVPVPDLGQNAVHHLRLPFVILATVFVAAIDHDRLFQP